MTSAMPNEPRLIQKLRAETEILHMLESTCGRDAAQAMAITMGERADCFRKKDVELARVFNEEAKRIRGAY